jgi:hypothetical protein
MTAAQLGPLQWQPAEPFKIQDCVTITDCVAQATSAACRPALGHGAAAEAGGGGKWTHIRAGVGFRWSVHIRP